MLLFIDDSESFITKSIIKKLDAKGYAGELIHLNVADISARKDKIDDYIFLNIPELASLDKKGLRYLTDICLEYSYKLYFMGYESDIDELIDGTLPTSQIGKFIRPINAVEVTEEIESLMALGPREAKKNILVVDDSGVMLNTIREWIGDIYNVSFVNSATNALTFLASHKPDLILLDYEMPICSGPQMLEMIQGSEDMKDIPVIFLTGKDDAESVKKVLSLHPAGYLLKSRPREEIVKAIADFFAKNS